MRIILASVSPRRKELLARITADFETMPPRIDEAAFYGAPGNLTARLSAAKAQAVAEHIDCKEDFCVIGADTVVYVGGLFGHFGKILGKPANRTDAAHMLGLLSDRTHTVYTGVSVITCVDGMLTIKTFVEKARVTFARLRALEIDAYIDKGEWEGKAGGYAAQGISAAYIKKVCGDFNTVVGLPLARLYKTLFRSP